MISSQDITNKKFERSTLGGYRNDDVDGFLNQVAGTIDQLEEQNSILTKKLEVLADKLQEYRNDEESLRAALLGAQKLGDSVIRESKSKAEIILRDATIKAERLVANAHNQVEKEKLIYIKMQKDVASFKNKLLATYKQHLEIISSLPEDPYVDKDASEGGEQATPPQKNAPRNEAAPPVTEKKEMTREEKLPEAPHPQEEPTTRRRASIPKFSYTPKQRPPVSVPEPAEYEEDYEDVGESADPDNPELATLQAMNLTAEEYYEAFEDEDKQIMPKKPSRFGTLKFGAGYDLKR